MTMFDVCENSGLMTVMQIRSLCNVGPDSCFLEGPGFSKGAFRGFQEVSWKIRNILPCHFHGPNVLLFLVTGFYH